MSGGATSRPDVASAPARRSVAVIGGGPAGLAAAVAAADAGASVWLIEAGDLLGGQFWRHRPTERAAEERPELHHQWPRFESLRERVKSDPNIAVCTSTSVWQLERGGAGAPILRLLSGDVDASGRVPSTLRPDAVVIASGAHDRTLPFPGWELPGVVSGGAAQALVKGEGVAIGERVVVAGAGPFLLPVAASLQAAGSRVLGIFEANRAPKLARGWSSGAWRLGGAAAKASELAEYASLLARHRIPYRLGHGVVAAHGEGRVEAVTVAALDASWRPIAGTERRIACDAVCVSHGFTPRLELAIAAGCELRGDGFVRVDASNATSAPGVYAAGEVTGIGGVDLALAEGQIAGHRAAGGRLADAAIAAPIRRRTTFTRFAANLERAHGIPRRPGWIDACRNDTIVCRCESTTLGELRGAVRETGSTSLRSVKLTSRAGLGPCQGRMCGRSVEAILGELARREPTLQRDKDAAGPAESAPETASAIGDDVRLGAPAARSDHRPIAVPIRLGELAGAAADPAAEAEAEATPAVEPHSSIGAPPPSAPPPSA